MSLARRRLISIALLLIVLVLISASLSSAAASYKIRQGDTLWTIAAHHHTTVAQLAKANHLSEKSVLALGKGLSIPGAPGQKPANKTSAKHVNRASKPLRQTSSAAHIGASSACLRSSASSASQRIALLEQGTTLKVLARNGKWAKVATSGGVCGFVYRPLLASGAGSTKPAGQVASKPQPDRQDHSLIRTALACRGTAYHRGGTGRGGFDCSGFTRFVYSKYGIALPHSSSAQAGRGTSVSRGELTAGDLVFFQTSHRGISHVGIYVGNGNFVHAESRGKGVTVDSLNSGYYSPRYRGARRIK